MQLMLLMPRIDSVLEVGTNEAIRSIQVKQVNCSMSLSVKAIPDLIPDTPAEDGRIPSKSGQEARQEFSRIMLRLRLSPRREREPKEITWVPRTPSNLQPPCLGQGFITIGHGHLPAYTYDGCIHIARVATILKAAVNYVLPKCASPAPLRVAFCKAAASPWR